MLNRYLERGKQQRAGASINGVQGREREAARLRRGGGGGNIHPLPALIYWSARLSMFASQALEMARSNFHLKTLVLQASILPVVVIKFHLLMFYFRDQGCRRKEESDDGTV